MSFGTYANDDQVLSSDAIVAPMWSNNVTQLNTFYSWSNQEQATSQGKFFLNVYAVDAAFVEFSVAVLVKISKSYKVVAGEVSVKVVALPNESVIIEGALKVKRHLISSVVIVFVVISPFSIIVPLPSS